MIFHPALVLIQALVTAVFGICSTGMRPRAESRPGTSAGSASLPAAGVTSGCRRRLAVACENRRLVVACVCGVRTSLRKRIKAFNSQVLCYFAWIYNCASITFLRGFYFVRAPVVMNETELTRDLLGTVKSTKVRIGWPKMMSE